MKKFNRITYLVFILFSLLLSSCEPVEYRGNNVELHTIATNSLLDIHGRDSDQIVVLESDNYGRNLFTFLDGSLLYDYNQVFGLLISQKTDNSYSYFYDNENYLLTNVPYGFYMQEDTDITQYFSNEKIEELKANNDWDKPINEEKLFKVTITNFKNDKLSTNKISMDYKKIGIPFVKVYAVLLTTDKNGNFIYFIRGSKSNSETGIEYTDSYAIFYDKEGNFDVDNGVVEITDIWDYQEQLKLLKDNNNWNK